MRPPEYIDKISVLLNPLFLNKDYKKKHIDPYNRLVLHNAGAFKVLVIKQEYLNPYYDHQMQVAMAIYELIKYGVILFKDDIFTPYFIYKNPHWFILNVVAIEFYSDYYKENIIIDEDMTATNIDFAKENDFLYQYVNKNTNEVTDTFYSNDKATNKYNRSSFIIYNKQEKDIKENRTKKETIDNMRPIRTEFRLYADNTKWLNWANLKGDYKEIFNRHKHLLAVIYNQYVKGCITVSSKSNSNFNRVIKIADEINPIRYSGNHLKKRIPIGKIKEYGKASDEGKKQEALKILDEFGKKNKNVVDGQNMVEMMSMKVKSEDKSPKRDTKPKI